MWWFWCAVVGRPCGMVEVCLGAQVVVLVCSG